jgi:hypothetical protein
MRVRYVSKQTLDAIAAEHPDMVWYCGPIGKDSEFELPPGTIAACIQMLEEPHPGEQVTTQEGSYFAVAPGMDSATHLEWLRNNYEEVAVRK